MNTPENYETDTRAADKAAAADRRRRRRNAARRELNAFLRDICGTSARAARSDMGI